MHVIFALVVFVQLLELGLAKIVNRRADDVTEIPELSPSNVHETLQYAQMSKFSQNFDYNSIKDDTKHQEPSGNLEIITEFKRKREIASTDDEQLVDMKSFSWDEDGRPMKEYGDPSASQLKRRSNLKNKRFKRQLSLLFFNYIDSLLDEKKNKLKKDKQEKVRNVLNKRNKFEPKRSEGSNLASISDY